MAFSERAALEGFLSQLKPSISIEIGTGQGGSLERLAYHSGEVHTVDIVEHVKLPHAQNVFTYIGDSRVVVPKILASLAGASRSVAFALVDGDHSAEGVREDIINLLDSDALTRAAILIHDSVHPSVREGIEAVPFEAWPHVTSVDVDFVPGRFVRHSPFRHELWGGFALVLLDADADSPTTAVREDRHYDSRMLMQPTARLVVSLEKAGYQPTLELLEQRLGQEKRVIEVTDVVLHRPPADELLGGFIDRPLPSTRVDDRAVSLTGWVLGRRSKVLAVELVRKDRVVERIAVDAHRPDISAAFPRVEDAFRSGFNASLDLTEPAAAVQLDVEVLLTDGNRVPLGTICMKRV